MHLFVAIVPPAGVCEAVADVVRNADATVDAPAPVPASRGSLLRRRRKGDDGAPSQPSARAAVTDRQLDHVPPNAMQLPITSFGNVTVTDAKRLGQALRGALAPLAAPTLHLAGSAALEFPGDLSVWAQVQGDLEDLRLVPPQITRIVEPLGFFVDRRQFRTMLSVATITDTTSIEVLQGVVDALDAFRGEPWTVGHVSLMRRRLDRDSPSSEEIERIPLAAG